MSFEISNGQGVEQSAMFDELNKTQMTFPPDKAQKNQMKIKQLANG